MTTVFSAIFCTWFSTSAYFDPSSIYLRTAVCCLKMSFSRKTSCSIPLCCCTSMRNSHWSTWELTKIPIEHNFEFWCIKKAIVFSILKEEKLAYENREICLINSINNFSLVIWKISRRRLPKEALLCHYWIQRYQKIQLDIRALFCVSFQISHHISGCCLLVTGMLLHSQISCKFFQTHEFDLHFDANFSSLGIIEYTFFHINFVLTCYSNKKHFTYSSCI